MYHINVLEMKEACPTTLKTVGVLNTGAETG